VTFAYEQASFVSYHVTFVGLLAPVSHGFVPFSYHLAAIFARGKIRRARLSGAGIFAIALFPRHLFQIHLKGQL